MTTAADILKSKPNQAIFAIGPRASVYDALQLAADKGVGALLVMEDERVIGIVTERDYARKVILQGRSSADTPVGQIMSSPVVSVLPTDTATWQAYTSTRNQAPDSIALLAPGVAPVQSRPSKVTWPLTMVKLRPSARCARRHGAGAVAGAAKRARDRGSRWPDRPPRPLAASARRPRPPRSRKGPCTGQPRRPVRSWRAPGRRHRSAPSAGRLAAAAASCPA